MKWLRLEDYKTIHIVVLLLALSLLPMLLSLPAFLSYLDFSSTGEIGDTIGGITAPFISVFAAILIFNAFKAQIKANELFKNQEISRNILHQIKIIQEDKLDMEKMVQKISILVDRDALRSPLQLDKLNAIKQ